MQIQYSLLPETFKLFDNVTEIPISSYIPTACAKNSTAAFQVAVTADESYVLNLSYGAYFSQHTPQAILRMETQCVFSTRVYMTDQFSAENGISYADALLTTPTREYASKQIATVYVEVEIPKDAAPGTYTCEIRFYTTKMFADEQCVGSLSASFTVYNYTMPDPSAYKLHLDIWQHSSNIARQHEVVPFSDAHFTVLESYLRSLGALGQKTVTLVVSEVPWNGQYCFSDQSISANLFEHSIIRTTKTHNGHFEYDYSAMQRYIDLCAKYGIDRELSVYGLMSICVDEKNGFGHLASDYPDAIRIRYFDESDHCYRYMRTAAEIDAYIAALAQYFIHTGQISRVRIVADEPADTARYRNSLNHLRMIAPAFQFKAALNHAEFAEAFREELSDFAPSIRRLFVQYDLFQKLRITMPHKRFLFYFCNGPAFPNNLLHSELWESWLLGILASYANMDGLLRWSYTAWPDHPRENIRFRDKEWPTGTLSFVYPGANGEVLLSLRYKSMHFAVELYELLETAKQRGFVAEVQKAYARVLFEPNAQLYFTETGNPIEQYCSKDLNDYVALKRDLLTLLSTESNK